jgi:archaellum biogenesis ATPase FlaH
MNHLSKTQNDPNASAAENREEPATFEYSAEIQKKIAAMVLYDDRAISQTCKIIRPKYFENPIIQDLVSIMLEYMEKYEKLMPTEALIQEVSGLLDKKPNLPSSMYWDMVEEISALGLEGDFDYVRDKVLDFARYEAVREAIIGSVDLLQKKRDYPEILRRIKEAVDMVPEDDGEELHCVRVSDVPEEDVHWLMPNRVPYEEITIWGGDPGAGKSYLSLWLAAHITAAIPWETDTDVPMEQGSVIILNTEDTIAKIVRKRLRQNLADLKSCFVIDSVLKKDKEGERLFSLTKDLNRLGKKIEEIGDVRLLIIDLLDTYLGAGVDSCKSTDISAVLAPLKRFAEQNHIAILGLMHLNKKQETSFLYRLLGSVKLIGIPRVVEFITKDRNDPKIRYFHVAKNNCTDEEWETLSFAFHKEKDGRIIIDTEADIPPVEETVGPETKEEVREKRRKTDEAVAILRELLERDAAPEAVPAAEVQSEHPDIYLNAWGKARKEVGVKHFQRDGVHWWKLKKRKT